MAKSKIIELVQKKLDETPLGELRDQHIKIINFFAKDVLKLVKYRVDIAFESTPKKLIIVPLDEKKKAVSIRFKRESELLDQINGYLHLTEYTVEFYKK